MKFQKIHIEISNICNLHCSFCPEVAREKKLMDLDLFKKIIEEAAPLTNEVCFHLLGDPLVHPRLGEFVQVCEEKAVKIFFVTNGVLLREKQAEILLSPSIRQVNFSLHSFRDNFPDEDPTFYLDRIFSFSERVFRERPEMYQNYRLWNWSDPVRGGGHNEEFLECIERRFQVKIPRDLNLKRGKSVRVLNRLYLHFDTEFVWPDLSLPVLGNRGRCYGLSTHFGILVDGTVVPCCLDHQGCIPLGNVKSDRLETLLKGPRAQAMLQGFQGGCLVEGLCQRCNYIERFK